MNKSDLIDALASDLKIPAHEAASIVDTILATMTDSLCRGESIEIRGFGSFVVKHYEAYEGRNPKTGKLIQVGKKRLPFFKVGKELREDVDSKQKG
jgi:integration host factor subunit beta